MPERWVWTRSYRLWEAIRRIFLYPEDWLQPEQRDDQPSSDSPRDDKAVPGKDERSPKP